MTPVHEYLQKIIKGEVTTDSAALTKASRDASIFEVRPSVVVRPKDVKDLQNLVQQFNPLT